jgi:hypothetical protein
MLVSAFSPLNAIAMKPQAGLVGSANAFLEIMMNCKRRNRSRQAPGTENL